MDMKGYFLENTIVFKCDSPEPIYSLKSQLLPIHFSRQLSPPMFRLNLAHRPIIPRIAHN